MNTMVPATAATRRIALRVRELMANEQNHRGAAPQVFEFGTNFVAAHSVHCLVRKTSSSLRGQTHTQQIGEESNTESQ
jgi:hypothetical protein